jgi:hypothetical protein
VSDFFSFFFSFPSFALSFSSRYSHIAVIRGRDANGLIHVPVADRRDKTRSDVSRSIEGALSDGLLVFF